MWFCHHSVFDHCVDCGLGTLDFEFAREMLLPELFKFLLRGSVNSLILHRFLRTGAYPPLPILRRLQPGKVGCSGTLDEGAPIGGGIAHRHRRDRGAALRRLLPNMSIVRFKSVTRLRDPVQDSRGIQAELRGPRATRTSWRYVSGCRSNPSILSPSAITAL